MIQSLSLVPENVDNESPPPKTLSLWSDQITSSGVTISSEGTIVGTESPSLIPDTNHSPVLIPIVETASIESLSLLNPLRSHSLLQHLVF